jgi:DeoR family transcriptional regulator, fructose operon transcriptional repressor
MWESAPRENRKISIDERRSMIIEEVNRRSSIQVSDICDQFGVSEVTARADLASLEAAGALRRTHGGAVSIKRTITVTYPDQRLNKNVEAKRSVAERAAQFVEDGDSILVDTGTTTFEFVCCLTEFRKLKIVTHDLSIATFAGANLPNAEVMLLGGVLRRDRQYATGLITNTVLDKVNADKAFLATDSFHPDYGFTADNEGNAEVKTHMLENAREHYMLMDASKVRRPDFIRYADVHDFDAILTDYDPGGALASSIRDLNAKTRLITTDDE